MRNSESLNQQKSLWCNDFANFEKRCVSEKRSIFCCYRFVDYKLKKTKKAKSWIRRYRIWREKRWTTSKMLAVDCCSQTGCCSQMSIVSYCKRRSIAERRSLTNEEAADDFDFIDRTRNRTTTNSYVEKSEFDETVDDFWLL